MGCNEETFDGDESYTGGGSLRDEGHVAVPKSGGHWAVMVLIVTVHGRCRGSRPIDVANNKLLVKKKIERKKNTPKARDKKCLEPRFSFVLSIPSSLFILPALISLTPDPNSNCCGCGCGCGCGHCGRCGGGCRRLCWLLILN
jgi:hypothetical protein